MSLISEALHKAQLERADHAQMAENTPANRTDRQHRRRSGSLVFANVTAVASLSVAAYLYWHSRVADIRPNEVARTRAVVAPAAAPAPVEPKIVLPELANAEPAATPTVAPKPTTDYDLAGMTVVGPTTLLSVSRRSDRKSVWIPVGKTVGEITAVSYDPNTDRAVIDVAGRTLTIRMRDGGGADAPATRASE
jgi:hypothetical protein